MNPPCRNCKRNETSERSPSVEDADASRDHFLHTFAEFLRQHFGVHPNKLSGTPLLDGCRRAGVWRQLNLSTRGVGPIQTMDTPGDDNQLSLTRTRRSHIPVTKDTFD